MPSSSLPHLENLGGTAAQARQNYLDAWLADGPSTGWRAVLRLLYAQPVDGVVRLRLDELARTDDAMTSR